MKHKRKGYWSYLWMALSNQMYDHIDVIKHNSYHEGRKAGYEAGYGQLRYELKSEMIADIEKHNLNSFISKDKEFSSEAQALALGYMYATEVIKGQE